MRAFARTLCLTATVALAAASAAAAKGPAAARIDGPGGGGGISIRGDGEGPGSPLGDLTTLSGFFPATFGQQPDPMLRDRPQGELGPRYVATFSVPGPNGEAFRIRMDLYPYARPQPVTYTPAGQRFFAGTPTHGGWYVATPALRSTLVRVGLPAAAAAARPSSSFPTWSAGLVSFAVGFLLVVAAARAGRRRPHDAPA